ncbi:MAG: hypothetical protein ACOYJE_02190 [Bacteroidaceae bacterium]|jgi:hypothetical protein
MISKKVVSVKKKRTGSGQPKRMIFTEKGAALFYESAGTFNAKWQRLLRPAAAVRRAGHGFLYGKDRNRLRLPLGGEDAGPAIY